MCPCKSLLNDLLGVWAFIDLGRTSVQNPPHMYGKFPSSLSLISLPLYCFFSAITILTSSALRADFRDDVDYTKLAAEYSGLPNGAGVRVLQVEYMRNGFWAPQMANDLADKNFTYLTPTFGGYSEHANEVARYLGRTSTSMTPGLMTWKNSEAVAFTGRGNLNGGRTLSPIAATWDIENHSWGGDDSLWCFDILYKEDYRIERDNIVSCVGVDNSSSMSQMLANGYNSIAVGVSSGNHPHTGTSLDTTGRMKPDLVGPASYTSYATPIVASSAALLIGEINRSPALSAARNSITIKALLLAGATKAEFPNWAHSSQQPLDRIFGAGEVNIYNSYKALVAGQQLPSNNTEVKVNGWDTNTTSSSGRRFYYFSVPAGKRMTLSAILNWNRHITPSADWLTMTPRLENLDLTLWRASSFSIGAVVSTSASTIDNVEHIYETSLLPGQYALEVVGAVNGEKYGLAWKSTLVDDGSVVAPPPPPAPPAPVPAPTPVPPPPAGPSAPSGSGIVPDSSFESVSVGVNNFNAFVYNPTVSGWTFLSSSGITGNNSGFTSSNSSAPDGTQVAFVQSQGSATVHVTLTSGTYQVTAKIANRSNWGGQQTVIVYVDDREVGRFATGTWYVAAATNTFSVADGAHDIRFAGQSTADATLFIDQVSVVSQGTNSLMVRNSGFENSDVGANDFYSFRYNPATVAGTQDWKFEGFSGITGNNSGFTFNNPSAPEGKQVGFVQMTGVVSQTVSFPTGGWYQLSVLAAQRGSFNAADQVVQVYLDDNYIGTLNPHSSTFQNFSFPLPTVGGAHVLFFRGTATSDCTLLIDRVVIQPPTS